MRMKRALFLLATLAALAPLALTGCIFSPDDDGGGGGGGTTTVPFPGTPDQLMINFRTAYREMNIDKYRDVLHPEYRFLYKDDDVAALSLPSYFHTYAEETQIAENMFSGNAIQRDGQDPVPGITSITINLLDRQSAWNPVGADDPDVPNTLEATYTVDISFVRASDVGTSTINVSGDQQFYVISTPVEVDGVTKDYYQLRGQRDRTNMGK